VDNKEAFALGSAVILVAALFMLFGAMVQKAGIVSDCEQLGKFSDKGTVFECRRQTVP
jgi:hypothetical protein